MSLSPSQIKAARMLAKGHTQAEVAKALGVTRRTIIRWTKIIDFQNLTHSLAGDSLVDSHISISTDADELEYTVADLVGPAIRTIHEILSDSDSRKADKLKACQIVGEWAGLSNRIVEMEALKVLVETNWIPPELYEKLHSQYFLLDDEIKKAFRESFVESENEKTP